MEIALPPYATAEAGLTVPTARSSRLWLADRQPTDQTDKDEAALAAVLVCLWSLASGRRLPDGVPLDQLSEEELIAFWADDFA
jgi:hypothetical protein